jgi:hypothetical protein
MSDVRFVLDISESFVFASPAFQNSCNMIYEYKKQKDIQNNAATTGNTYKFKTDFERMQYLLGLYGQTSLGRA